MESDNDIILDLVREIELQQKEIAQLKINLEIAIDNVRKLVKETPYIDSLN